jgi:hypothetical protein
MLPLALVGGAHGQGGRRSTSTESGGIRRGGLTAPSGQSGEMEVSFDFGDSDTLMVQLDAHGRGRGVYVDR